MCEETLNLRRHVACLRYDVLFAHISPSFSSHRRRQTSNSVYEIVSDMSTRQDALEERLSSLEDKLQGLQVSIFPRDANDFHIIDAGIELNSAR